MQEYQSNSHRSKENREVKSAETLPAKKFEKVVSGDVKTRDNKTRKFMDMFISEDVGDVKSYIVKDILVPGTKKVISEIVKSAVDMFLYGSRGGSDDRRGTTSKVSYRKYYDDRDRFDDRREGEVRTRFRFDDLSFETRTDAEIVRRQMLDAVKRYGFVTVADMYDMAGSPNLAPYTANDYGWMGARIFETAEIIRVRDGRYIIKLPSASPID
jgi:hypothetical protein